MHSPVAQEHNSRLAHGMEEFRPPSSLLQLSASSGWNECH